MYSGIRLIFHKDMLPWVFVPIGVSVVVFLAGLALIGSVLFAQIDQYLGLWPSFIRNTIWWFLICTLSSSLSFLLFAFSNLLAAPFNSQLSLAVEHKLGNGYVDENISVMKNIKVCLASITAEVKKLKCFSKIGIPLLLLTFIPGPNIFVPIAWLWFGSWMLSLEYLDYPLSNHDRNFPASQEYAAHNRGLTLGFGFALTVITMIPIVSCLAMPTGVAAGTILYDRKIKTHA